LLARGTESSTSVEVRGDPQMSITLAEYQDRERFLLDLLALRDEATALMRTMGVAGGGRFGQPQGNPNSPENRIRAASRAISGVYSALNGSAVRTGSLYAPTRTMRDQVAEARATIEELKRSTGR
jgi:hypothetical protein